MFLLVSVRHVGAHPGEHQHGVSIQISISLGKTFLRISRIRNIPLTWILARVFVYVPPFISHILDFIYWTVLIFILIYFEWRDTENQQFSCLNRESQKLVPTRNFSHLEPQKFVPANHKKRQSAKFSCNTVLFFWSRRCVRRRSCLSSLPPGRIRITSKTSLAALMGELQDARKEIRKKPLVWHFQLEGEAKRHKWNEQKAVSHYFVKSFVCPQGLYMSRHCHNIIATVTLASADLKSLLMWR